MSERCASCSIRDKIRNGCCVQGNQPNNIDTKIIVQRKNGKVVRRIEACANLDPTSGACLDYFNRAPACKAFNESGCALGD